MLREMQKIVDINRDKNLWNSYNKKDKTVFSFLSLFFCGGLFQTESCYGVQAELELTL